MTERTRISGLPAVSSSARLHELIRSGATCTAPLVTTTDRTIEYYPNIISKQDIKMVDTVTLDYKKLIAQGHIINNPMSLTKVTISEPHPTILFGFDIETKYTCPNGRGGYTSEWIKTYSKRHTGQLSWQAALSGSGLTQYLDPIAVSEDKITSSKNKAVTAAWANIDHSELLGAVCAKEAGKTLETVRSTLGKALRIIRAARKKSWRLLRKEFTPSNLADSYMEARYGLRPLYYDIAGAFSAYGISKVKSHIKDRFTFRGKDNFSDVISDTTVFNKSNAPGYGSFPLSCTRTSRIDVENRAGVLTRLDLLTYRNILGFSNVAESLWEIVPFSFIVDWFANVGQTISAWAPNPGSQVLASWCTTVINSSQSCQLQALGITNTSPDSQSSRMTNEEHYVFMNHNKSTYSKVRAINPGRVIMPELNIRLSPAKLLDLALIVMSLRKEANMCKRVRL